ncbi:unnamed protein product [Sphagnum balticum]
MLKDYQGALQDLDEANVLLPNNAFILVILSHVHWHLNNYRLALECLNKVDVDESDDYFIFQYNKKWLKWLSDEYQPIIESLQFNSNVKSFTFDELVTKNDSRKRLGQGLYGIVYEGNWEGKKIAIKILKGVDGSFNEGAKKSFISEVRTLGSIRHINLVQLLGYCIEGEGHALVYEYMSKSSLDKWLFDDKLNHFLNWHERMHIIIGIAKGLAFLHQCNPIILHLDIKPQNILLDIDYTPKLADFGLARLLDGEQCQGNLSSTSTPGTSPYMAPEVHLLHQVSTKSDVYSFGVLLIEIVSGKKTFNVEGENVSLRDFTKWAKSNYVEGEFEDILDGVLNNSIVDLNHNEAQKLMKIALECIQVIGLKVEILVKTMKLYEIGKATWPCKHVGKIEKPCFPYQN